MSAVRLLLPLVLALLAARQAEACECPGTGPPCQAAWNADAVFVGTVRSLDRLPHDEAGRPYETILVRFDVEQGFVNAAPGMLELRTAAHGTACGYHFTAGKRYLVYARKTPHGSWSAGSCSRTRPIEQAGDDLQYFTALPEPTGGRVFGSVRHRQRDPYENRAVDYGPLEGLTVSAAGAGFYFEAVTDASGRFDIMNLPVGQAAVALRAPHGAAGWFERDIELRDPRACSEQNFEVTYVAAAHGRVLDASGRPAAGVMVDAVAAELAGHGPEPFQAPARTDEQGHFAFEALPPGDYVFGVNLTRRFGKPPPAPPVFLPGTRRADQADIVRLERGARVDLGVLSLSD